MNLRELLDDLVGLLQQFLRFRNRDTRIGRRHPEEIALVKRRNKLTAETGIRNPGDRCHQHRQQNHRFREAKYKVNERLVGPDKKPAERILLLRANLSADQNRHQHRDDRDRKQRRGRHRERLGIGQRAKQPAFLCLQRKDRQEGQRNDHKAVKQCGTDLFGGIDNDRVTIERLPARMRPFQMLVGILHHHHAGIDHHTDRNRDAPERHDVGVDIQQVHRQEGDQYPERQSDHRHEGTAEVKQEQKTDQGNDDQLFGQLCLQDLDRIFDQGRTIVDRYDLDTLRQP